MKTASLIVCSLLQVIVVCTPAVVRSAETGGALQDFTVRTWSKADGLPNASVTAILQTRDAYLWVGTGAGLVRFDGMKFTEVPLRVSDTNAPVAVTALCEDSSGHLWIGSQQQGLFCLVNGRLTHYGKTEGLLDEEITSLTTDREDGLWIGTKHGANRWNGRTFASYTRRDGLPDDLVTSVHAARSGAVWITTRGGMCKFVENRLAAFEFQTASQGRNPEFLGAYEDSRSNLWAFGASYLINLTEGKRFNYFHGDEPASVRIWSLCAGRDGRLWIGTSGRGLFCFDGNKFQPVPSNEGSWANDVRAICEDHEGNLWLGISEGGLARLRPQSFLLFGTKHGLPAGGATCLAMDPFQRVAVGMEQGGLFLNQGLRFERFSDRTGLLGQDPVSSISAGAEGSLWVGTTGTGLYRAKGGRVIRLTTANGLSDDGVVASCSDTDGATWVVTRGGLHRFRDGELKTFSAADGFPEGAVTALLPAREGGAWIGTEAGLLLHSDGAAFQAIRMAPRLVSRPVLGLYEDVAGRLWIGSAGGGLGCLEARRCRAWSLEGSGLDDVVSALVDDADGNLWLMTGKGICRVAGSSIALAVTGDVPLKVRLMFELAGGVARGPVPGGQRALRSPDGRLWFATTEGLLATDPRNWLTEQPPPRVRLEGVLVNNKRLASPLENPSDGAGNNLAPVRMPANLRALEIQFTALSFAAPEKVRFRHRLDGFDTDWVETDMDRRVRYGGLPPGRYEFRVIACNANGAWNEEGESFAFIVPTMPWRAPWALGLYGIAATGLVVRVVRLVSHRRLRRKLARLEQQQSMERERVRIAQDMHDEIGSKLTKISFLSERAKAELRETGPVAIKIDSIAHTSRELLQALDEIVWAVNPRNDTLEHLAAYLGQYAAEYFQNTTVECELRLQGELPQQPMSAEIRHNLFLAFEESLNNILKHSGATRVRVDIKTGEGQLQITINDNGRGFVSSPETGTPRDGHERRTGPGGNGLFNMHERLSDIGGQCDLQSCPGKGTTVSLSIPLHPAKMDYA